MSPLTASVNESSVGATVVIDSLVIAAKVLEVALVTESVESLEPDAHAVSAIRMAKNLINRRKCTRNKFEKSFCSLFKPAGLSLWSAHEFAWQFTCELVVVDSLYAIN